VSQNVAIKKYIYVLRVDICVVVKT